MGEGAPGLHHPGVSWAIPEKVSMEMSTRAEGTAALDPERGLEKEDIL